MHMYMRMHVVFHEAVQMRPSRRSSAAALLATLPAAGERAAALRIGEAAFLKLKLERGTATYQYSTQHRHYLSAIDIKVIYVRKRYESTKHARTTCLSPPPHAHAL